MCKKRKKILAVILMLVTNMWLVSMFSVPASAAVFGDYEYWELYDGTIGIVGYNGSATEISIPSTINGKAVTGIGDGAFIYCDNLEKLIMPSGITNIGENAFSYCENLKSINIADGVTSIGSHAFSGCSSLKELKLPSSLYSIGSEAFVRSGLERIIIPQSLTHIANCAFRYCRQMTEFIVEDGNSTYSSYDGVLYQGDTMYICPGGKQGTLTLKPSVNHFFFTSMEECFGIEAFALVDDNEYFQVIDGVVYNKEMDTIVRFPQGRKGIYSFPSGVSEIDTYAFNDCAGLKEVFLPDGLEEIGYRLFYGCRGLKNLIIPDSVTSIGRGAFQYCSSLMSITIPGSVIAIGDDAFFNYPDLRIYVSNEAAQELVFDSFKRSTDGLTKEKNIIIGSAEDISSGTCIFNIMGTDDYDEAIAVFTLLNELRTESGLPALVMDYGLTLDAMQRAAEISIYFEHARPDGSPCLTAISADYVSASENIALGQMNAAAVIEAWTDSPGHYGNMMSANFNSVGIGCFYQKDGTKYWVQLFTREQEKIAPVDNGGKQIQIKEIRALKSLLELEIFPASGNIFIGESQIYLLYNALTNTQIIPSFWESEDESIATIDINGEVIAVGEGNTKIKMGINSNFYQEINITVSNNKIEFIENERSFVINGKFICFTIAAEAKKFLEQIKTSGVKLDNVEGEEITGGELVGTGAVLYLLDANGDVIDQYTVIVTGDVNGDGKIAAADARLTLRASAQLENLEGVYFTAANVNNAGKLSASAARKILRVSSKLETL